MLLILIILALAVVVLIELPGLIKTGFIERLGFFRCYSLSELTWLALSSTSCPYPTLWPTFINCWTVKEGNHAADLDGNSNIINAAGQRMWHYD